MNNNTLLSAHGRYPLVEGHYVLHIGSIRSTGRAVVDEQEAQDGNLIIILQTAKATLAFVEAARAPNDGRYWTNTSADGSRTAHRSGWTTAHDSGWPLPPAKIRERPFGREARCQPVRGTLADNTVSRANN